MNRALKSSLLTLVLVAGVDVAAADALLIRNATVHTAAAAGTLKSTDVLVDGDRISAIGPSLAAPAGAHVIDAAGRPLTPGFFGGLTHLGIEETGFEPPTEDYALQLGTMRPEFDVSLAFNPDTAIVGVNRIEGVTFAAIVPTAEGDGGPAHGGTIVAGQGAMASLNGEIYPDARALYVDVGGDASQLSGGSRAAQFMLLRQAFTEVRSPKLLLPDDQRLLAPLGRAALLDFLKRNGLFVFGVDRASDIQQVLAFASQEKLHIAIAGGAEAWRVAKALAAANVPVIIDPLADLPENFDSVGSTLQNAARLNAAGVHVAFSSIDPSPHNIRKLRQTAGIAVANGLPWDAGLAGLTRVPAEIFGLGSRIGSIEVGRRADLVLWSGDPLEVTSAADEVVIAGLVQPKDSRQTLLRDRYLERVQQGTAR
jgi:imidazolonepropionase-like amidohydrolase